MSDTIPQALLFVLSTVGNEVSVDEFNDWYNNEHAPARLGVEGFHSALRYEATDEVEPKWLAMYEIDSPEVPNSDAYQSLSRNASERERKLVPKLGRLNRRVYSLLGTHGDSGTSKLPAKHVIFASVGVKPEDEEEYQKWCVEEHIDLLSKVPGWVQSRRYKLVGSEELVASSGGDHPPAGIFLNVHYSEKPWSFSLPEAQIAMGTPWASEVLGKATSRVIRLFALHQDIGKPTWK